MKSACSPTNLGNPHTLLGENGADEAAEDGGGRAPLANDVTVDKGILGACSACPRHATSASSRLMFHTGEVRRSAEHGSP